MLLPGLDLASEVRSLQGLEQRPRGITQRLTNLTLKLPNGTNTTVIGYYRCDRPCVYVDCEGIFGSPGGQILCSRSVLSTQVKWKDRKPNTEILQLFHITGIEAFLLTTRLRWAGQRARMDDDRLPGNHLLQPAAARRPLRQQAGRNAVKKS